MPSHWLRHYPEHISVQTPDNKKDSEAYAAQINFTTFSGDDDEDAFGPKVHAVVLEQHYLDLLIVELTAIQDGMEP
jgi:hypothetical protein